MYIISNEVSIQNQLAIGGVTHKLIYMLKPFNLINVRQHLFSYSNTSPHVWVINKVHHVHTILIKRVAVITQYRAIRSNIMLNFIHQLSLKQTSHTYTSLFCFFFFWTTHKTFYLLSDQSFRNVIIICLLAYEKLTHT